MRWFVLQINRIKSKLEDNKPFWSREHNLRYSLEKKRMVILNTFVEEKKDALTREQKEEMTKKLLR